MLLDTEAQRGQLLSLIHGAAAQGAVQGADDESVNRLLTLHGLAAAVKSAQAQDTLDAAAERKATADAKLLAVADHAARDAVRAERARVRRKADRAAEHDAVPVLSGDGAATEAPTLA